eukprot:TRINITY_DN4065_c0_g1_i2.p1 TRINITY_DN4065_c0_g1~~TRINITY_DN4065_c0_g1_i2.p1  ORF type:complete len:200 (+),score=42.38 TRINITY_DN4065_c0_g1_i2:30-629(+)
MGDENELKLVVVGDGAVGKTCLLISFAKGTFPENYVPTVFENYTKSFNVADKKVDFDLWDTAGQEDFDRLRPLSYPDSDIVLICYSVIQRSSFKNVADRWLPEVRHYCPVVPILLVGLKTDLRNDDKNTEFTSSTEGAELCKSLQLSGFAEASAKTKAGVDEIFSKSFEIACASAKQGGKRGKAEKEGKSSTGCACTLI